MNSNFSLKRVWYLSRLHFVSNKLIFAGALAVILVVILYIFGMSRADPFTIRRTYDYMLMLAGAIYSSTFFAAWSDKGNSTMRLMLPATSTEKFVTCLLFTTVLYFIVFTVFYTGSIYLLQNVFFEKISFSQLLLADPNDYRDRGFSISASALHLLVFQSFFIAGSVIFNRRQFFYSSIVVFVLFFLYIAVQSRIIHLLSGYRIFGLNDLLVLDGKMWAGLKDGSTSIRIGMSELISRLNMVFWIVFPAVIYYVTFLKLKQKEI